MGSKQLVVGANQYWVAPISRPSGRSVYAVIYLCLIYGWKEKKSRLTLSMTSI